MSDEFCNGARPAFRVRDLLVSVNAQRFGSFGSAAFRVARFLVDTAFA